MKIKMKFANQRAALIYGGEPKYATPMAAAIDLRACIDAPVIILPGEQKMIPTGIHLDMTGADIPMAAIAMPRSGRGSKEGLVLGNTLGLIDKDYQGEVMLCAWARPTSGHVNASSNRLGGNPIHIEPGERIAQLAFVPVLRVELEAVSEFVTASERGEGGFGSTGQ